MVLLHRGRVIAETNYLQSDASLAKLRVSLGDVVRTDDDTPVAICFDHWHTNFYHWTAHTIPALHAVLEHYDPSDITLLLPVLQPWQIDYLTLFNIGDIRTLTIENGRQHFFKNAIHCNIVNGSLDYSISPLSRAAYARVSAALPDESPRADKIYIDRSGSPTRGLANEGELIAALRKRGFAIVRLETLSVAAQILLFRGAAFVVGLHGAGLANIAYCQPKTVIYEICPNHYVNQCYMIMALQGDLTYWIDAFPSGAVSQDHTVGWGYGVDIERIVRRVAELEDFVPTIPRLPCDLPAQLVPGGPSSELELHRT
jgi:capsular polysaccharide biosynthesis protein